MPLRSLGFRTDVMLLRMQGSQIEDRGDRVVVRTPTNPDFYWGNFIVFPQPPTTAEAAVWLDEFAAEVPGAKHVAIGIDGTDGSTGDIGSLLAAGCTLELGTVMTATAATLQAPPRPHADAVCRPLADDADWEQAVALWAANNDSQEATAYQAFARTRLTSYREIQSRGQGTWFGAFVDGLLLSSLGIFAEDGVGRYQHVDTHPDHRGQGLAGTLVHRAGQHALDEMGVSTLVMVADPAYLAVRVYRSVGFRDQETQVQLQRSPPTDQPD